MFTTDETLEADFEVAHFGSEPLERAVTTWRLVGDDGKAVAAGELPAKTIPIDNGIALGHLSVALKNVSAPARYKLVASIQTPAAQAARSLRQSLPGRFENDWDVWVYPSKAAIAVPDQVTVLDALDQQALNTLAAGGKVLLLIPPSRIKNAAKDQVAIGFSSIFWNTAWTRRQAPTTLGILCDPKQPALAEFPTDDHSNWQWWYLISRARAMILDDLPAELRPTVQVIDDWFTARKLGLLFEARLGQGKLAVCSIDLEHDLDTNPVARQFRHSLLRYLASAAFKPRIAVTAEQVRGLFTKPSAMQRYGARIFKVSSAEDGFPAANAIDGDPNTMWHTQWTGHLPTFPHELAIEFDRPFPIGGFTALPRQDNNRNGWIKDYTFYVSQDGRDWGEPVAKGTFPNDARLKTVQLDAPKVGRFVRLVALSGHANGPWASLAELEVLVAGE